MTDAEYSLHVMTNLISCSGKRFQWSVEKAHRPDHHGGVLEGVVRTFPVVPLDAVKWNFLRPVRVIHAIQVGRATCLKPPSCRQK